MTSRAHGTSVSWTYAPSFAKGDVLSVQFVMLQNCNNDQNVPGLIFMKFSGRRGSSMVPGRTHLNLERIRITRQINFYAAVNNTWEMLVSWNRHSAELNSKSLWLKWQLGWTGLEHELIVLVNNLVDHDFLKLLWGGSFFFSITNVRHNILQWSHL